MPLRLALVPALVSLAAPAWAQDDDEEETVTFDEPQTRKGSKKEAQTRDLKQGVIREIERGFYVKGNVGTTILLGARAGLLQPGTTLNLAVGQDFIDKPKFSVAWDLTFYQGLHNSALPTFSDIGAAVAPDPSRLIQGDTHVFGALVGVEASAYPLRRLGIGAHLGGGVAFAPLLMAEPYYTDDVVDEWGGIAARPAVHDSVLPAVYAGPTLEYYTKLSHFSLGVDVDFLYIIGLDYGISATGFLKYTF
jgi:hypothetical protein